MVKFYETSWSYDYSFGAVSLAYFLRYPNPYSKHVLSTDVIEQYVDPQSRRLHTTRLHLKRSKVPAPVLKLLGTSNNSARQAYVLERSVIDAKEGWMETESRNLEFTGVLSVIERQSYSKPQDGLMLEEARGLDLRQESRRVPDWTDVRTVVTFHSHLGERKLLGGNSKTRQEEESSGNGVFATWSRNSIQRSLELIGAQRTKRHLAKSVDGMQVVLERMRQGGLVGVLEGMKKDRESMFVGESWR